MSTLPAKMKILLIIAKSSWKTEIKTFTWKLELVSNILWRIADTQKKLLWNYCILTPFFAKQWINSLNTLVIEVVMIAHINIKNPSIFKSQNWERKSLFHKTSYKQENFKRCKIIVVTKTLNVKKNKKSQLFSFQSWKSFNSVWF